MIFVDAIFMHGRLFPNRPAIMLADRLVTFGMLAEAIHWVSARILAAGLAPGDTVIVAIDNPIRFIAVTSALMRLGIVVVPVHSSDAPKVPLARAVAIVTDTALAAPVGLRLVMVDDVWFQPNRVPYPLDPRASDPGRLTLLALTSGTTGQPKFIPFTVEDLDRRIRDLYRYQPAPGTERDLLLLGLSSQWALAQAARVLVAARTLCFAASAEEAARMIDLYQVGTVIGSPQQLSALLEALDEIPASCASLRLVKTGGGRLSPQLLERIKHRLSTQIVSIYGSTEAGRTAMASLDMLESEPGCVGLPVPDKQVDIVDDADRPLPAGATGRIRILVAGGGQAFVPDALYPDRTPGWFYPGDTGYFREDGLLVVVGRTDELINAGGLKVAPERVELIVADRRDIADCAAFGLPGPGGIDQIWLAIVPRGPVRTDELLAWCAERSEHLAPKRILVVDAIPRNAMGKPERARLKARAAGG